MSRWIGRNGDEMATDHQSSDLRGFENRVHHVRVTPSWLLDGEIVATPTGNGVHAGQ